MFKTIAKVYPVARPEQRVTGKLGGYRVLVCPVCWKRLGFTHRHKSIVAVGMRYCLQCGIPIVVHVDDRAWVQAS